jgi:hypothetical protein
MADLGLKIMVPGFRSHLDFFHLERRLLLFGFLLLFRLLVFETAVVHYLADRRVCIGRHLHQIKAEIRSLFQCFLKRNDAYLSAVGINDPDLSGANVLVDVDPVGSSLPLVSF